MVYYKSALNQNNKEPVLGFALLAIPSCKNL